MNDTSPTSTPIEDSRPRSRALIRRLFTLLYAAAMVAAAGGLGFVWLVWDPPMAMGMKNAVSTGIVMLSFLLSIGWLVLFSPFRWRTVLITLTIMAVVGSAAAASIREIAFDGDMGMIVEFRWEPTAQERLAAHREAMMKPSDFDPANVPQITPVDMPTYRGEEFRGIITGPPLSQDWQSSPPRQLWSQPCGGGYSQFVIVGDFLVTLEQRGENEAVVCYDAPSGIERWLHEYPAAFEESLGGPGPRATPTIDGTDVFSYGAEGDLLCLDLRTGDVRWHVDALPEGARNADWAMCSSPLVLDGFVIVEAGGPQGDGLIAYDRATGDVVWDRPGVARLTEPEVRNRAGYSSAVLVTIHSVPQILIFDGEGLRSHVPETGEQLWFHEFKNQPGVNVAQPILVDDGRIFLSQSYGVGCRMIDVTLTGSQWQTATLWNNLNMKCKFTSPVLHEGYLYGLDEGILVCLDPETGEREWKKGRFGHGQVLLTNGHLVIMGEKGDVALVDATPEEYHEVTRFRALVSSKVWNPHCLANGIVYVRNHEMMAAYDLRAEQPIGVTSHRGGR